MASIMRTPNAPATDGMDVPAKVDGRRERSAESRRRILAATLSLVDRGTPQPTAEQIAAEARVSLRSVFRHFEDMESLQIEIANEVNRRIGPWVAKPFEETRWPQLLDEVIRRRSELFDTVLPFKTAMEMYRLRSRAVAAELRRLVAIQRDLLWARMPAHVREDATLFEALNLTFSIESWQRLREGQGLSKAEALAVWTRLAAALAR